MQIGQWLPIISRVVMRTLYGDEADSNWHWNVVQNNGMDRPLFSAAFLNSMRMLRANSSRRTGRAAGPSCPFPCHPPAALGPGADGGKG
jgi:hypothetical protein